MKVYNVFATDVNKAIGSLYERGYIFDIGQLTMEVKKELERMVRRGETIKDKALWPNVTSGVVEKTIYVINRRILENGRRYNKFAVGELTVKQILEKVTAERKTAEDYFEVTGEDYFNTRAMTWGDIEQWIKNQMDMEEV